MYANGNSHYPVLPSMTHIRMLAQRCQILWFFFKQNAETGVTLTVSKYWSKFLKKEGPKPSVSNKARLGMWVPYLRPLCSSYINPYGGSSEPGCPHKHHQQFPCWEPGSRHVQGQVLSCRHQISSTLLDHDQGSPLLCLALSPSFVVHESRVHKWGWLFEIISLFAIMIGIQGGGNENMISITKEFFWYIEMVGFSV